MPTIVDPQLFANNAITLLAAPITSISLSFTVMAGHGAKFPQPTGDGSDWFILTLESQDAQVREIIKVIDRVGDVFTIDPMGRGYEGTTAQAWGASSGNDTIVDLRLTAEGIRRMTNAYNRAGYPLIKTKGEALDKLFDLLSTTSLRLYDQPYTLTEVPNSLIITLDQPYTPGTLAIFVGGLRQKAGVDYNETGLDEITLTFELTQEMIDEGQNLVIDFGPA